VRAPAPQPGCEPAAIDGPRGGYWATALGLTGWGLAVAYSGAVRPPDVDIAGVHLAGVGLAGLAAALLRTRGFVISEAGLALGPSSAPACPGTEPARGCAGGHHDLRDRDRRRRGAERRRRRLATAGALAVRRSCRVTLTGPQRDQRAAASTPWDAHAAR